MQLPAYRPHRPTPAVAILNLTRSLALLVLGTMCCAAGDLDTIGVTRLRATDPTLDGSGVRGVQAEADAGGNSWEVNPAAVGQLGRRFTYRSSAGTSTNFPNALGNESSHANTVGGLFYGLGSGVATNLASIENIHSGYFFNDIIAANAPLNARLINQSWVFGGLTVPQQQLADTYFDNYIAQSNSIVLTGAGNGGPVVAPATCYNGIGVAAFAPGALSSTGPTLDNGRSKPDLAAPGFFTSFSTPLVAGCAAVLVQAGARGDGGPTVTNAAVDARTIKALLLNGAVKPDGWTHTARAPLDTRYGAGVVNIDNSWRQLTGGRRPYTVATTSPAGGAHPPATNGASIPVLHGWDLSSSSSSSASDGVYHYLFDLSNSLGSSFTLTATLTWFRQYNRTAINDLDLFLYNVTTSNLVAASTSVVDNVEHLFTRSLPPGRYDLQVLKNGGTSGKRVTTTETYALAFEFTSDGAPPVVALTNPANGAVLTAPATFALEATASDPDGSVTQVEFFQGATSLWVDTTSPYSVTVSSLAAGVYSFAAVATDSSGATATNHITVTVNDLPIVALTTPTNGASYVTPASVTLTASASDSDGTINRVIFYADATPLGTNPTAPFNVTWNNVPPGTHTLTAVAEDNLGGATTSGPVVITVTENIPPTVALTSPANGAVLTAPATFALQATASDLDGTVTQVEFFQGTTSLGVDTTNPYSVTVSSLAAGAYSFAAVATDSSGATATNRITVTVNDLPIVALTTPTNGASYVTPASVTLTASASDSDGTINRVIFYADATPLGTNLTAPFNVTWNNVPPGTHILTAVAEDNLGGATTSGPVVITVTENIPPTVALTSPANGAVPTAPATFALQATASDPDGSITQVEFFQGTTSLGVDTTSPYSVTVSSLAAGVYSFAAVATDSSGATATNRITVTVNDLPIVALTTPTNGASYVTPASVTLTASASDSDGTINRVIFYDDATPLGTNLTAPFSLTWNNVPPGTHALTAVAEDNLGGATTSAPVVITVTNRPPVAVRLQDPQLTPGGFTFSFQSELNRHYAVQRLGAIGSTNWQTLTNLVGTGGTLVVRDPAPPQQQRYYRTRAE